MSSETITRNDLEAILNAVLPQPIETPPVAVIDYTIPSMSYAANAAHWHYADNRVPTKSGYTFVGILGYSQNSSGLISNLSVSEGRIAGYTWNRTTSAISQPINVNCLMIRDDLL